MKNSNFLEQIEKVKDRVEHILEAYPQTRNSDKLLWLAYMSMFGEIKEVMDDRTYQSFKKLLMDEKTPTFESLSRCRRKLQESGEKLQASDEVKSERKLSAKEVSEYFKNIREKS